MELIKCNECGQLVPSTAKVCPECGCPLEDEISKSQISSEIVTIIANTTRCPHCHSVLISDMKECPECGYNLTVKKEIKKKAEEKSENELDETYEQEKESAKRKDTIISTIVIILLVFGIGAWLFLGNDKEETENIPNATITMGDAQVQKWLVGTFDGSYTAADGKAKTVSMDIDSIGNVRLNIKTGKLTSESEGKLVAQHGDSIKINFSKGYYEGIETSFRIDTLGHRICPEGDAWINKNSKDEKQHE